jgi:phosphatidylglycerol:prolipoprotein diacylglycerol transferase
VNLVIAFDPIIARFGPFELGWHGVFTTLAVIVAVWLGRRLAVRRGVAAESLDALVLGAVAGGLLGARLFHVLDHLPYYLAHPWEAPAIWQGGIAVYGAFLGGLAGGILVARRRRLPVWTLLDVAAPAMLVGQAIGRLGCLCNGDAWGAPCSCPWCLCVTYTHPNALLPHDLLGVPTYPYPLYEIGAGLVLLVGLWLARDRLPRPGATFLVAALGYAGIRFGLSFFRQETVLLWGLQEAQLIALATALAAAALLFRLLVVAGTGRAAAQAA